MGISSQDTLGICPGRRASTAERQKGWGSPRRYRGPPPLYGSDVLRDGPVEPQALAADRCPYARRRQRGGASLTPAFVTPNIASLV
jgi:hypothetical protein